MTNTVSLLSVYCMQDIPLVFGSMQYSVSHTIYPTDLLHTPSILHFETFKKFLIYFQVSASQEYTINPLKAELNTICHLLALLGAHRILHVSRISVKNITVKNPLCYGRLAEDKI